MTYAVTISGNNISFSMEAVAYSVSLSQSGLQGATGTVEANTGATINGDLNITDKIVHAGDTNTAIRFPAADTVTVETAGVERVRVDSAGNVGIGTSSPSNNLHVVGSARISGPIPALEFFDTGASVDNGLWDFVVNDGPFLIRARNDAGAGGGAYTEFTRSGNNTQTFKGYRAATLRTDLSWWDSHFLFSNALGTLGTATAHDLAVKTNNTERLRIDSSGNVGIGTSAPGATFHVAGTTYLGGFGTNALRVVKSGSTSVIQSGDGAGSTGAITFAPWLSATPYLHIANTGNVGIGESAPDYKLDVNGTFGFTPGASVTPVDNGDVVFELTNNTTLTIKAKGSDGVVRSGTVTLA